MDEDIEMVFTQVIEGFKSTASVLRKVGFDVYFNIMLLLVLNVLILTYVES